LSIKKYIKADGTSSWRIRTSYHDADGSRRVVVRTAG
jgi:hypothetical protein